MLDKVPRPLVDRQLDVVASFGRALCDHLDLRAQIHASEIEAAKAADVDQAVRTGRVVPWYQPIIDLRTSKVIGLEALARRIHPDGRVEMPAVFIPIAERSDIIIDLDLAVAGMALRDVRRWQRVDPALTMSVNLSGRHLDQAGRVAVLESLASAADVSPFAVQLEITETAKPSNRALAAEQIRLAQALGFSVWLDDFGSGWSGLSELLHLKPDGIKLDQSFAGALETRAGSVLIRALTTAATTLGVTVVMEGIERPEQAALARELGCDYGQGFLWSAPVPAVGVDRLRDV